MTRQQPASRPLTLLFFALLAAFSASSCDLGILTAGEEPEPLPDISGAWEMAFVPGRPPDASAGSCSVEPLVFVLEHNPYGGEGHYRGQHGGTTVRCEGLAYPVGANPLVRDTTVVLTPDSITAKVSSSFCWGPAPCSGNPNVSIYLPGLTWLWGQVTATSMFGGSVGLPPTSAPAYLGVSWEATRR